MLHPISEASLPSKIYSLPITTRGRFGSRVRRRCAPFTYDAWHHPETLAIVSKIAGVDLIPAMNCEIAHVNISVKSVQAARDELDSIEPETNQSSERPSKARRVEGDEMPVVGWHRDSYPFVCVTMLSDCTNMVGGETALRTADNKVLKVRGPEKVCRSNLSSYEQNLTMREGLCGHHARPLYHTPSAPRSRRPRAHHHGHIFPSEVPSSARRRCALNRPRNLGSFTTVLRVRKLSPRDIGREDSGPAEEDES